MSVWRTCPHCKSNFQIETDNSHYIRTDKDYCPMCNMNKNGDEKGKGIK